MLRAYPDLQTTHPDEEPPRRPGGAPRLSSTVIDGRSAFYPNTGERKPKFCIKSPGNPLLCDGKSDDRNHAVIFMSTRGGVSEAQKGLPLSEDVFAGTNALDVVDGSSTGSITSAAKDEISISAPFSTSGPSSAPV